MSKLYLIVRRENSLPRPFYLCGAVAPATYEWSDDRTRALLWSSKAAARIWMANIQVMASSLAKAEVARRR